MKNISYLLILVLIFFNCRMALAATNSDANDPAYNQAKQDYRAYLEQLRTLRNQYRQVTDEVKKIIAEEGVPTWDEKSDQMTLTKRDPAMAEATVFGDADIKENEKNMVVKMDLPGLQKDKIKISIENNQTLKISGNRELEKESEKTTQDARYYKLERQRGAFERLIKLPVAAQDSGTQAQYENGVLTVRIPKAQEAKKEVAVSVQ